MQNTNNLEKSSNVAGKPLAYKIIVFNLRKYSLNQIQHTKSQIIFSKTKYNCFR